MLLTRTALRLANPLLSSLTPRYACLGEITAPARSMASKDGLVDKIKAKKPKTKGLNSILGLWKCKDTGDVEPYLKAIGHDGAFVNTYRRSLGFIACSVQGNTWTCQTDGKYGKSKYSFKLGEQFSKPLNETLVGVLFWSEVAELFFLRSPENGANTFYSAWKEPWHDTSDVGRYLELID